MIRCGHTSEEVISVSIGIDKITLLTNLPLRPRQRFDIPHFDHRLHETLEECGLVLAEFVDQVNGVCALRGKQLLVALKQAIVRSKVGEIVLVEGIRCGQV